MIYGIDNSNVELLTSWSGIEAGVPARKYMTGEKISALRLQIGKQAEERGRQTHEAFLMDSDDFDEELVTFARKETHRLQMETLEFEAAKVRGEPPKKRFKRGLESPTTRRAATEAYRRGSGIERKEYSYESIPVSSGLPFVILPTMASTKVAYIVNSVVNHPEEKFLVFSGGSSSNAQVSNNNLYYLAEALDLASVPHLIFVRTLSQEKLATYAKAFSESKHFRVLLLDIKVRILMSQTSRAERSPLLVCRPWLESVECESGDFYRACLAEG